MADKHVSCSMRNKTQKKKSMADDNSAEDCRNREEKSSGNMNAEQEEVHGADSPTDSLKTISDDDEIDYSVKPEFYDAKLDEKDELWAQKQRKGRRTSDALLSCPACFTTLCLECQRHEKYLTQYRAIFVRNCKIKKHEIVHPDNTHKRKRGRGSSSSSVVVEANGEEAFRPVCCSVCSTKVGVIDEDEVYHFFNVIPSEP